MRSDIITSNPYFGKLVVKFGVTATVSFFVLPFATAFLFGSWFFSSKSSKKAKSKQTNQRRSLSPAIGNLISVSNVDNLPDINHLPTELLLHIFSFASPQDLGRSCQVNKVWKFI